MVFEARNAYFETEAKIDEESIQDKIDRNILEIRQLTKENLKKLRVDILYSKSHLRIRDENGKIIGKLKDNQVVDFNGERKVITYKGKQKVFLGINFKKGDKIMKGFIAADYVKGDIIKTPEIKNEPPLDGKIKDSAPTSPKVKDEVVSGDEEVIETPKKRVIGYIEKGRNYIIGENGEPKLVTVNDYPDEFKEALKDYQNILIKVENLNILLQALNKQGKDIEIKKGLDQLIKNFDPQNLKKSIEEINKYINTNFDKLNGGKVKDNNINLSNKLEVYKYIREELKDYQMVNNLIIEQEFHSLVKELSPEKFQDYINNPDKSKIKEIVGDEKAQEITEKVINKRAEAEKYWNENQDEIINNNIPNFSDLATEKQNKIRNNLKNNIINIFVGNYTKNLIMNEYIEKNLTNEIGYIIKGTEYNGKGNDYIDLYADINGIGDYDFSDKTLNWGKEAFIFIATEVAALIAGSLTMGAGAVGVNTLVYGTRTYKGIKWMQRTAKLANKTLKGAKYTEKAGIIGARTSRFAAMTTIEGGTFYLGYGATQSLIEGKNTYSKEGLYESMAFVGAFKMLGGIYKTLGMELKPDIPLKQQKLKLTSQLIIEGTTLSGMGLAFDGVIFEPGEWDAETIIQAFIMAALFKGVGRLTVKKEGDKILLLENKIGKLKQDPNHPNFYIDGNGIYWTKKGDLWIQKKPKGLKGNPNAETTNTEIIKNFELPKSSILEVIGKNGNTYEVTTNENGEVIKVFNKTKNLELKGAAKNTWIKFNLEKIKEKYGVKSKKSEKKEYRWSTEAPIDKNAKPINPDGTKPEGEKIKKDSETIETNTKNQEILTKKLHSKFKEFFNEHFPSSLIGKVEEKSLTLKNNIGEEITIKMSSDKRFTISGDNKIYTRKEILEKIKNDYPEYEKNFLKQKAKERYNEIKNNKKELIIERNGLFFRPNQRITERGLEIKKEGKWEVVKNQKEIDDFLNNNPKIEKLLSKSFEEKIEQEIKDKGLKKALLKNKKQIIKEIFLGKAYFNLWLPGLYAISEIDDYKNINIKDFLKNFTIAYLSSAALNGAFLIIGNGAKFLLTTKPIKSTTNFLWKHKYKIIGGGAFATGVYMYHVSEQ